MYYQSNLTQHLPSLSHTTRPHTRAHGGRLRLDESFRLPYRTSRNVEMESRSRSRYSEIESLTERIARDWVLVRRICFYQTTALVETQPMVMVSSKSGLPPDSSFLSDSATNDTSWIAVYDWLSLHRQTDRQLSLHFIGRRMRAHGLCGQRASKKREMTRGGAENATVARP